MIVLLSPAKSLDFESEPPFDESSEIRFAEETEYLVGKLKKMSARKLKSLMNISEDLAQLNAERYAQWSLPFTEKNSKQAIFAFTGDVYQGLEAQTLKESDLTYAQDHIRILSGLYGILRPLDRIQPYRLEMGTKWSVTAKKNNLYKFWREKLTQEMEREMKNQDEKIILNLASNEYSKAVDLKKLGAKVISPEFKEDKGDKYQMISFFAKKARGMMARYVVENRIEKIEDLRGFDSGGYHFNNELSDTENNKWVFTRIYESNQ